MKQKNLKTIFAVAALSLGVVMPLADANAGPVVVFPASESSERSLSPWDDGYESQLKAKKPEKYKTFQLIKEAIADPAKNAKDIKKMMDGEWFGGFSPGAVKYIDKARKDVLGHTDVKASNEQVLHMMKYMRGCKNGANMVNGMLGGFAIGGLVLFGVFANARRPSGTPRP